MSESIAFMVITDKPIKKGELINFEDKQCKITSINIAEPFVGGKIRVIGKCKQTDTDKWSSLINKS